MGISGLWGFVGVDLILGADAEGREDLAIEINPRLTTSYVGLRALLHGNLAGLMLRHAGASSERVGVASKYRVAYTAAGSISIDSSKSSWNHPSEIATDARS